MFKKVNDILMSRIKDPAKKGLDLGTSILRDNWSFCCWQKCLRPSQKHLTMEGCFDDIPKNFFPGLMIPAWSGFNAITLAINVPMPSINYLPFVHAPPTYSYQQYTTWLKNVSMAEKLGQSRIFITADFSYLLQSDGDHSKERWQCAWETCTCSWLSLPASERSLVMRITPSIHCLWGACWSHNIPHVARETTWQSSQWNHEAMMYLYLQVAQKWSKENNVDWIDTKRISDLKAYAELDVSKLEKAMHVPSSQKRSICHITSSRGYVPS